MVTMNYCKIFLDMMKNFIKMESNFEMIQKKKKLWCAQRCPNSRSSLSLFSPWIMKRFHYIFGTFSTIKICWTKKNVSSLSLSYRNFPIARTFSVARNEPRIKKKTTGFSYLWTERPIENTRSMRAREYEKNEKHMKGWVERPREWNDNNSFQFTLFAAPCLQM